MNGRQAFEYVTQTIKKSLEATQRRQDICHSIIGNNANPRHANALCISLHRSLISILANLAIDVSRESEARTISDKEIWDVLLAATQDHLRGIGPEGSAGASAIHGTEPTAINPILRVIARSLWLDLVQHDVTAKPLLTRDYAPMPKMTAGMSWAFGAPTIEIDGRKFGITPEPGMRILGPRTSELLPRGLEMPRPTQATLPLAIEEEAHNGQLAMEIVSPAQGITTAGAKIALLALSDPHIQQGGVSECPGRELAVRIHGGVRYQKRMLKATVVGLTLLRGVWIFLPDGSRVRLFSIRDVPDSDNIGPDVILGIGLDSHFKRIIDRHINSKGSPYCGAFLLDISGSMALPMTKPELLRLHVRASSRANAAFGKGGRFDADRLGFESIDELAIKTNAYPSSIAEALPANGRLGRAHASAATMRQRARRQVRENLEALEQQYHLWMIEQRGKQTSKEYRLLPTSEYLAAWDAMRHQATG